MSTKKSNNNPHVTIYEPNHIVKAGIKVWGEMFRELVDFRVEGSNPISTSDEWWTLLGMSREVSVN